VELLGAYRLNPAADVDQSWPLAQQGRYAFGIQYLEMLLARPEVLAQLSNEDLRSLLEVAQTNFRSKMQISSVYGGDHLVSTVFLSAHIMREIEFERGVAAFAWTGGLRDFLKTSRPTNMSMLSDIELMVRGYLAEEEAPK
jgi:hypothetical protein